KSFKMCHVRGWNLSYESLTSFDARNKLRELKVDDPVFWNELLVDLETSTSDLPASNKIIPEDIIDEGSDDEYGNDSSIRLAAVVKAVVDKSSAALKAVGIQEDRGLMRETLAEDDNEAPADLFDGWADESHETQTGVRRSSHVGTRTNAAGENLPQGCGQRKNISNKQFTSSIHYKSLLSLYINTNQRAVDQYLGQETPCCSFREGLA
ncbi:hypothetical protein BYT27DRAFT_7103779, partial [Phlegmacium glaucopus]